MFHWKRWGHKTHRAGTPRAYRGQTEARTGLKLTENAKKGITLLLEDKREREKSEEQERKSSDRWLVYGLAIAVSLVTTATAYVLFKLMSQ